MYKYRQTVQLRLHHTCLHVSQLTQNTEFFFYVIMAGWKMWSQYFMKLLLFFSVISLSRSTWAFMHLQAPYWASRPGPCLPLPPHLVYGSHGSTLSHLRTYILVQFTSRECNYKIHTKISLSWLTALMLETHKVSCLLSTSVLVSHKV